jgi:hypothetical protein
MTANESEMWRDCTAWLKDEHIHMGTTSNEACKLYDCALTQIVTWRDLPQYDGLDGTLRNMLRADPDFLMGHVLKSGVELIGSSAPPNASTHSSLQLLSKRRRDGQITEHERLHVDAIIELHGGNLRRACDYWESILLERPNDMMALKFAHDVYFYTGSAAQMRDSVARVLPNWSRSKPLYSFLYGMLSFGLVQTNYFDEARHAALTALEMNRHDAWATHSICHFNEYRYIEVKFMTSKKKY